jgi:hypothetical protein
MNTAFEIVSIPLNKLVASSLNVRKTGGQTIEDLAASIQAHGLLHNLVVAKKGDKHHVIAGTRRFAALRKLAKQKAIPKTFDVPCRVIESCYEVGSCLSLTSEKGGCRLDNSCILASASISMSCRPMVISSSTVRSPITSRIAASDKSRRVPPGLRTSKRYSLGSSMRYCTTHSTSAAFRSPVTMDFSASGSWPA